MLKESLLKQCYGFVNEKLSTIETFMTENRRALENESKSSAGDKHETGRAMLHLEMEKASQQLAVVRQMQHTLGKIDPKSSSNHIKLGSLVKTDQGDYFLSISAGELSIEGKIYYAVSPSSPIGSLLMGKQANDEFNLMDKIIKIKTIQ